MGRGAVPVGVETSTENGSTGTLGRVRRFAESEFKVAIDAYFTIYWPPSAVAFPKTP